MLTTPTSYGNEASSDEAPIDKRHLAMRQHLRRPAPMPQRQRRSTASAFMPDVLEGAHHIRDAAKAEAETSDCGHGTARILALAPLPKCQSHLCHQQISGVKSGKAREARGTY
jgi:hypothetical protein